MSDPIIKVENISKRYRIGAQKEEETLVQQISKSLTQPLRNFKRISSLSSFDDKADSTIFWALQDINFEVKQGEVLGIIGHNGAGKSTLLKILSRITEPTSGQITLRGRVSALLEVGTGFHPELTGRDNIYMNGTILGMRKREIDFKLDEIISFSGVEQHLDTPVKFYSSGMKVRLAFSVAAHLEPEILIIDEVLAVGDVEFQKKCLGKMEDVANQGRTVLFVSHNMGAVHNLCSSSIVLNSGKIGYNGKVEDAVDKYLGFDEIQDFKRKVNISELHRRIGYSGEVTFESIEFTKNPFDGSFASTEEIQLLITLNVSKKLSQALRIAMSISSADGTPIGTFFSDHLLLTKENKMVVKLTAINHQLAMGQYYFSFSIGTGNSEIGLKEYDVIEKLLRFQILYNDINRESMDSVWNGKHWGQIKYTDFSTLQVI